MTNDTIDLKQSCNDQTELEIEISEKILASNNPELNYHCAINLTINKIKHLEEVIKSKDPVLNYKCIKHCIKTKLLTEEEKEELVEKQAISKVIYENNNYKVIEELERFLKYNYKNKKYIAIGINCGTPKKKKKKHR